MSVAKKILSNTAIQVMGKLMTAALSIVIIKAITSLETIPGLEGLPAEYKLIYTYLMFFGILADFGLFTIGVREMSQSNSEEETSYILGNILGMRLFTIVLAMGLASGLVFLIPLENYSWNVKVGVTIAAITTVFTMLASTTSSILQVKLRMALPTIALVVGKGIMAGYIIWTVFHFHSTPHAFYHLIYAGVLGSATTFLITYVYTKSIFPFTPRFNLTFWRKIFKEALPYGLAIILSTIYFKVDVLLLSFLRDKQEIALYGYPSSIMEMLLIFPIYFMNSTLPTLSKAFRENLEKAKKVVSLAFTFLLLIGLPMVIGGVLLATPIINLVMNEEFLTGNVVGYFGADTAFQILIIPMLFAFMSTLFSFTLIAKGEQAKLLKINFIGVVFNIVTNFIFIPHYGFIAAGITTLFSELLILGLTYRECRKGLKLHFDHINTIKIILASTIMGVFVYITKDNLHIMGSIGVGALVFFLMLIPLRVLNGEIAEKLK